MKMWVRVVVFLSVALIGLGSTASWADQGSALSGRVVDPTGAAIPNSRVVLTTLSTGATQSTGADQRGRFEFKDLTRGRYRLQVDSAGFAQWRRDIELDSMSELDVQLSPAALTETVTVIGGESTAAFAGGQVSRGAQIGSLGYRDIMDTPFNITSYTAQSIENQQARSVADVTANDPSVRTTASSGGILDSFFIRGFPVNEGNFGEIAVDGVFGIAPAFRLFTEYAERVDVIKGPTALLNGIAPNSSVGGTINVVPKRALATDLTRLTIDFAPDRQLGGHLDLSRRFGVKRQVGVRFNGSYRAGNTPIDNQWRQVPVGAFALDYQGQRLRVTLDLIAQRESFRAPQRPLFPASGITIPNAPDSRRNLQQSWETSQIDDRSGLTRVEYDLGKTLTVFASGGGGATHVERLFGTPVILRSNGDVSVTPQNFVFDIGRTAAEAGLRGHADTGAIKHAWTVQMNRFHERLDRGSISGTAQFSNIFDPARRPGQDVPEPTTVPKASDNSFLAFAVVDTLSLFHERLQATVGVRRQHVDSNNFSPSTGVVTSSSDEGVFTPVVGVVVKPRRHVSLYANYIEGLSIGDVAPATAVNAGEVLPPFRSKQIEAGAKFDFGRVGVTVSGFQIEKPFGQLESTNAGLVFSEAGRQRHRGPEVNIFGEPLRGVRLLGGLTLLDGEITKTPNAATLGKSPIGVPTVQFNLGGEWDAPFVSRLTIIGNVFYTGDQFVNAVNTQNIPSWTRIDLGGRYRTTVGRTPLTLRATIQNVVDRNYWSGVASFGTLAQGAPRTAVLSVSADF